SSHKPTCHRQRRAYTEWQLWIRRRASRWSHWSRLRASWLRLFRPTTLDAGWSARLQL
ncbi:hypothetical protein N0V82_009888, partial [Gnomoniopsis sp. IMI 355080]